VFGGGVAFFDCDGHDCDHGLVTRN
jgi:hypothetical protein